MSPRSHHDLLQVDEPDAVVGFGGRTVAALATNKGLLDAVFARRGMA